MCIKNVKQVYYKKKKISQYFLNVKYDILIKYKLNWEQIILLQL